jgi:hypothetical protein
LTQSRFVSIFGQFARVLRNGQKGNIWQLLLKNYRKGVMAHPLSESWLAIEFIVWSDDDANARANDEIASAIGRLFGIALATNTRTMLYQERANPAAPEQLRPADRCFMLFSFDKSASREKFCDLVIA